MAIGYQRGQLPEGGCDPDAAVGVGRPPDFDAVGMGIIGDDTPMGESQETARESFCAVGRDIDTISGMVWSGL